MSSSVCNKLICVCRITVTQLFYRARYSFKYNTYLKLLSKHTHGSNLRFKTGILLRSRLTYKYWKCFIKSLNGISINIIWKCPCNISLPTKHSPLERARDTLLSWPNSSTTMGQTQLGVWCCTWSSSSTETLIMKGVFPRKLFYTILK